ncbi:hypothetical protein EMIHUDRAFT_240010 [Emiliania huxleyi CCMP1516]|uniref:Leucine rich repeat protein n=2 Tax=Emiliania huxleyi TaxID=2903 RepID=A0A0D3JGN3_EMIH1|nr:hypothetical protein EMIHUDRAFT_240010 [Emiliania huxleyi CCMP1516]EOD22668.1 hypothetical protein EMIHUDRAFT_240010 [Emiliania huxleyi CCMP1516]|eukprot:XP_005775097.1 hypothetical protein EMIHUDRAFT_240010 [Emiliania huxleyi CCMP1516]
MSKRTATGSTSRELRLRGGDVVRIGDKDVDLYSTRLCIKLRVLPGKLPEAIGKLVALQRLYATNNQLGALPEAIGKLVALRQLQVQNNQLGALPEAHRRRPGELMSPQKVAPARGSAVGSAASGDGGLFLAKSRYHIACGRRKAAFAVLLKYRSNAHDVVREAGTYADDPGPIGSLRKLLGGR